MKLRPFWKTELPSMGCRRSARPDRDTGLPKTAIPPVPLNSTRLPSVAPVPPTRLFCTPGSPACPGRGALGRCRCCCSTIPCSLLPTWLVPLAPTPE